MKSRLLLILGLIIIISAKAFALDENRKVGPIDGKAEIALTKSLFSITDGLDRATQNLVYTSYIAGFLDAAQLEEAGATSIKEFLARCEGLNLGKLTETMSKFYLENPQWRNTKPAEILTVVAPRLKEGLTPFPSDIKEQKQ